MPASFDPNGTKIFNFATEDARYAYTFCNLYKQVECKPAPGGGDQCKVKKEVTCAKVCAAVNTDSNGRYIDEWRADTDTCVSGEFCRTEYCRLLTSFI